MCVIIYKPEGFSKSDRNELLSAIVTNPDGFGVWKDGEVLKTMNPAEAIDFAIGDVPTIFHARIATGSRKVKNQCHPFDAGVGRYLFHNGIAGKSYENKSDTQQLAEKLRQFNTEDCLVILEFLNSSGKGKFILTDNDEVFTVGIDDEKGVFRSNKNHIIITPQTYPRVGYNSRMNSGGDYGGVEW